MLRTFFLVLAAARAADLAEGPGRVETLKHCGRCHSMDQSVSLRQARGGWTETITKMVNLGVQGSEEELNAILLYLVKHYGAAGDNATSAAGTAAKAESAGIAATARVSSTAARAAGPASAPPPTGKPVEAAKEWRTYGHDPGAMRFSPLKQITPANVAKLKVAWVYHMRPEGYTGAGAPPPRRPLAADAPAGDEPPPQRSRAQFGSGYRPSEVTPLVIGGIMYITTPYSRVAALDPVNGREIWSFQLPSGAPSTRGLEYWPGGRGTPAQVVFGSSDGKLYSLDAKTGSWVCASLTWPQPVVWMIRSDRASG